MLPKKVLDLQGFVNNILNTVQFTVYHYTFKIGQYSTREINLCNTNNSCKLFNCPIWKILIVLSFFGYAIFITLFLITIIIVVYERIPVDQIGMTLFVICIIC